MAISSCQTPHKQEDSLLGVKRMEAAEEGLATIVSEEHNPLKLHNAESATVEKLTLKEGDQFTISDQKQSDSYRVLKIKKDEITFERKHTDDSKNGKTSESVEDVIVKPYGEINGIPVDFRLADMVEEVLKKTNLKINISAMTEKTLEINKVNGVDVCNIRSKERVLKLQKFFVAQRNIYKNESIYSSWVKKENGNFTYVSEKNMRRKGLKNACKTVYISVR